MTKEPFISVTSLGDLRIRDVFARIDYPKVFVCEDALQTKYLFYEVDSEYEFDSWLVIRISNKRYYDLITQQVGIVSAFIIAEEKKYHTIKHYYSDNRTTYETSTEFDRKLLSIEDFFPEKSIDSTDELMKDVATQIVDEYVQKEKKRKQIFSVTLDQDLYDDAIQVANKNHNGNFSQCVTVALEELIDREVENGLVLLNKK